MPNWCECELDIEGETEEVSKFMEKAKNQAEQSVLCFNNFVPMPKDFLENHGIYKAKERWLDDGNTPDWYAWSVENWGTKWDSADATMNSETQKEKTFACYDFMTAWSPPIAWLRKVVKQFPKLNFKLEYSEGGMGFKGKFVARKGKVLSDKYWNMTAEDFGELGYTDDEE